MRLFGRRSLPDDFRTELAAAVATLATPCVRVDLDDHAPASAASSYAAGYPYVPDDRPWPTSLGRPMFFVAQIAFAEAPDVDGLPSSGLLQWFVAADDLYGLSFDATAGKFGFEVRWYDDTSAPALFSPSDPTPWHSARSSGIEVEAPLDLDDARHLRLSAATMLPAYAELGRTAPDELIAQLAVAEDQDPAHLAYVWDASVRGGSGDFGDVGGHSNVGGYASFTQEDPRGTGGYPALGTSGARLLLELDSAQVGGWGDAGIGHLFGDPAAVGRGDLTSVTYHWDCY